VERPGFLAGARLGALAGNPRDAAAPAKGLSSVGDFGLGAGGGAEAASSPAIVSHAACTKTSGGDLPKPNFSGRGSVFGTKVSQTSSAFRTADARCPHLSTVLPGAGAAGATGPPAA